MHNLSYDRDKKTNVNKCTRIDQMTMKAVSYRGGAAVKQIQKARQLFITIRTKGQLTTVLMGLRIEDCKCGQRFQSMYSLTADGIYGPKTKAKIEKLLK